MYSNIIHLLCFTLASFSHVLCIDYSKYLDPPLDKFAWMIGKWHSRSQGIVHWPTIPTMRFSETLEFWPAEKSKAANGLIYINYTAIATSHNSGDHFHNEYGYLTVLPDGKAKMFAVGNNGFATVEKGWVSNGYMILDSEEVNRVIIARELPTEAIRREFRVEGRYLRQTLSMRTITHPSHTIPCGGSNFCDVREHATNYYIQQKSLKDLVEEQEKEKERQQQQQQQLRQQEFNRRNVLHESTEDRQPLRFSTRRDIFTSK